MLALLRLDLAQEEPNRAGKSAASDADTSEKFEERAARKHRAQRRRGGLSIFQMRSRPRKERGVNMLS